MFLSFGKILLAGKDITQIRDSNISRFRRENLGFVFQDFNLLDNSDEQDPPRITGGLDAMCHNKDGLPCSVYIRKQLHNLC